MTGEGVVHVWTPTWVVVDGGQHLQMRPEAGQVGGVTSPLQDDGQLLDAFRKRLWRLELFQGHTAGGGEHLLATHDRVGIGSDQHRHTHSIHVHECVLLRGVEMHTTETNLKKSLKYDTNVLTL